MKILMVTDFYHPHLGGVEQHVRTLATGLAGIGHEVTVATLGTDGLAAADVDGDVSVVRLDSTTARLGRLFSQPRTWAPPVTDPELRRSLGALVASVDPDVVPGHDWMARSLVPTRRDVPYGSSLHYYTRSCARKDLVRRGEPCDGPAIAKCLSCAAEHYGPMKGTVTAAGLAAGSRLEDRSASAFIAVSRATAIGNRLDPDAENVFIIPNFLGEEAPAAPPGTGAAEVEVDELLGELPDEPFIAYVGDFRAIKGFELLMSAYERCETGRALVIIGKRWPETPATLPDGVHVFEQWPNRAVRHALARAAVAVVPSMWEEPFGIVAIEALAAGTPVIAADVGGLGEIIADVDAKDAASPTGITFARGDVGALVAAIDRLAADEGLRSRLGKNAEVAARRYSAGAVIPRIVEVYEQVRR